MDQESQIVAEKIESGAYFREGLSWFHSKFTGPRTEFSYVLILCVLSLITLFLGLLSFSEIFPLEPGANFYMSRPIIAGEHITIKRISGEEDKPNAALVSFLLKEYVKAHEEYFQEHIDRNTRYIYSFSTGPIYQAFLDGLSTDNPQSPLLLYGQLFNEEVRIGSVKLFDASGKPATENNIAKAAINYQLALIDINENTETPHSYQADISFQYKQITVDQKTAAINQKPELVVTSYTTKQLQ